MEDDEKLEIWSKIDRLDITVARLHKNESNDKQGGGKGKQM